MRSNGAFVGHKQEVRPEEPEDPWSMYGVFAMEWIERDEALLSVPLDLMIEGDLLDNLNSDAIDELVEEIMLGDDSNIAPYICYLKSIPEWILPKAWSDAGHKLLGEPLGNKLLPQLYQNKLHNYYVKNCEGGDDPFERWMVHLVALLEIDEGFMLPYLDFFNHRNGPWHNANGELHATLGRGEVQLAW
eukprot:11652940-Ditylum_brightwellii.AAC.2